MPITLAEARANIGAQVVFTTAAMRSGADKRRPEQGEIRSVGSTTVFVNFGRGSTSPGCYPADLDFLKETVK
jgi:hypothetical protein